MVSLAPLAADDLAEVHPMEYRLQPRDLVRIQVLNETETLLKQRVDGRGRVHLPYLGPFKIQDRSVREAEVAIEAAYREAQIFTRPQVILEIVEHATRQALVLGQVDRPGAVIFPVETDFISILQAIADRGGFTPMARGSSVRVTRPSRDDSREQTSVLNVDRLLREGQTVEEADKGEFRLFPGDIVYVPERIF